MISSLECDGRGVIWFGGYHPNHISIGCQTNHVPNIFSKCNGILCRHVPLLNRSSFSLATEIFLMLMLGEVRWNLGRWSILFMIWIMRSPFYVDLRCVFSHWSSLFPGRVLCRSHHLPFGQIWRCHWPSSLFPSVVVYQLALTMTISIPMTWNLLSTIKIFAASNQMIFNQQSLCHCLL